MAGDKNLKKRPKAGPSRIESDIKNDKVILDGKIADNDIQHIAETEELACADLPQGYISVPLNLWLDDKDSLSKREHKVAVQIAADEDPEDLNDDLSDIDIIILPFVSYVDGRSYSHAYKLRTRLGFKGEIRAVGDVHYDQLDFLTRVGCNAFELPEGDNYEVALSALSEFSDVYQPSADQGRLIFSRRRAVH